MSKLIHIGIIDDHLVLRQGLITLLKEYENLNVIISANNGKELMEALKTNKPNIILLDIEMPVMNGREALAKINENYPKIKVIILSQHFEDGYIIEFIKNGASVFSAYIQPCVYSARVKAPIIDSIMLPEVLENENIINVSPNPNNGIFNITFSESVYGSLKIYNSLGGIVYQEYLKETVNQKTINLSDNKSGFYYIVLQTIEKTYSSKFIIND